MKKIKFILPVILLMLLTSCAAPVYNIRLNSGKQMANPNYFLRDITGETNMMITFWFTGFSTVIDKDGTEVFIPHTLSMDDVQVLDKNIVKVTVTIDIYNPNLFEYSINYNIKSQKNKDGVSHGLAVSDLIYRHYTIDLPIKRKFKNTMFYGSVLSGDVEIFTIGPFQYERRG